MSDQPDLDAIIKDLREKHAGSTQGEWVYRPRRNDDWGFVRAGRNEPLVMIGRSGRDLSAIEENAHRADGTDPYGDNAKFVAAAHNHLPAALDAMEAVRGQVMELTASLARALDIIETGFRKPFDHVDGCLFKADRRMPCQCDPRGRMERFRTEALTFLDSQRAALAGKRQP